MILQLCLHGQRRNFGLLVFQLSWKPLQPLWSCPPPKLWRQQVLVQLPLIGDKGSFHRHFSQAREHFLYTSCLYPPARNGPSSVSLDTRKAIHLSRLCPRSLRTSSSSSTTVVSWKSSLKSRQVWEVTEPSVSVLHAARDWAVIRSPTCERLDLQKEVRTDLHHDPQYAS